MNKEVPLTQAKIPSLPLVVCTSNTRSPPDTELPGNIEATFRISGKRELRLDTSNWNQQASNFFSARTASNPENLLNHVQRIMHHIELKNSDSVYGALLDLFIVLNNHGRSLRQRMLQYARPVLQQQQYARLHRLLDKETSNMFSLTGNNCSILFRGLNGSRPLVERNYPASDNRYNRLNEARNYIENGQLTVAKAVLASAIIDGCLEHDIHTELLGLYRQTHDKTGFLKIYPRLQIQQKSLLALWQELNDCFASDKS